MVILSKKEEKKKKEIKKTSFGPSSPIKVEEKIQKKLKKYLFDNLSLDCFIVEVNYENDN